MEVEKVTKADGSIVGHIVNGIFVVNVVTEKHLFRKKDAWCINTEIMERYRDKVKGIRVQENWPKGPSYSLEIGEFMEAAEMIHFRGYGMQYAVPRKRWNRSHAY